MGRRIQGFLRTAEAYIPRNPGKTAQEIVDFLLKSGQAQSAALEPQGSLVATLHKYHRRIGVERRREGAVYRYYPNNGGSPPPPETPRVEIGDHPEGDEVVMTLRIPRSTADVVDTLIASGTSKDRGDAVNWLVNKGITAIRLSG